MSIDDLISALEDARGQVGGQATVVIDDAGFGGSEREVTQVGSYTDFAVIR